MDAVYAPVTLRNVIHWWLKAVCVVAFVAAITEQQLLLMISAVAELAVLNGEKRKVQCNW